MREYADISTSDVEDLLRSVALDLGTPAEQFAVNQLKLWLIAPHHYNDMIGRDLIRLSFEVVQDFTAEMVVEDFGAEGEDEEDEVGSETQARNSN